MNFNKILDLSLKMSDNINMKTQKKPSSINLPVWMDMAIRELAQAHKRSMSGEIEFLVEEAIKNNAEYTLKMGGNAQKSPPPAA
jgi:hypothetical protein